MGQGQYNGNQTSSQWEHLLTDDGVVHQMHIPFAVPARSIIIMHNLRPTPQPAICHRTKTTICAQLTRYLWRSFKRPSFDLNLIFYQFRALLLPCGRASPANPISSTIYSICYFLPLMDDIGHCNRWNRDLTGTNNCPPHSAAAWL